MIDYLYYDWKKYVPSMNVDNMIKYGEEGIDDYIFCVEEEYIELLKEFFYEYNNKMDYIIDVIEELSEIQKYWG